MNKLLDHLPFYYQGIREFQHLTAAQTEKLEEFQEAIQSVENDQFILTSSEAAIARREKDFRIIPDPEKETLEFRKRRLLLRMQSNPPYVYEYLRRQLNDLLGEDQVSMILSEALLEMEVLIGVDRSEFHEEVRQMLERIVPLNIDLFLSLLLSKESIELESKAYAIDVPYPRTNTFLTAAVEGRIALDGLAMEEKAYAIDVIYPITNVLYASGNNLLERSGMAVEMTISVWTSKIQELNENMRVGEVTL